MASPSPDASKFAYIKIEVRERGAVVEREREGIDSLYHITLGDSDSDTRSQESSPVVFDFPLRSIDRREV